MLASVDFWLDVDVRGGVLCDGSDAPLHVLSVESSCASATRREHLDGSWDQYTLEAK